MDAMRRGIDYAWGRPSIESIKEAGASFACRYYSWLPNAKCLTRTEADYLRANGIDVVSNWEYYGDWSHDLSGGYAKGRSHATEAAKQHEACGGPPDRPIYFSTDWDVTDAQKRTVADYYRGVASVIGLNRTGAYGGYWVIKYLLDAGVISWAWQTFAWSGGNWDTRNHIRQVKNRVNIGGVDCDLDDAMTADFGQWGAEKMLRDETIGGTTSPGMGDRTADTLLSDIWNTVMRGKTAYGDLWPESPFATVLTRLVEVKAGTDAQSVAAIAAIQKLAELIADGGGNVDTAAIVAAIREASEDAQALARELLSELTELRIRDDAMAQRLAQAYTPPGS